jgi:hypothetical protein
MAYVLGVASESRAAAVDWTAVATVALALITAVYVYLTYRLLRVSRESIDLAREQFRHHSMIELLPHLALEVNRIENGVSLSLSNYGDNEAIDLDVMVTANYSVDDRSVSEFVRRYGHPRSKMEFAGWEPDGEGFYYLYDHLVYGMIPRMRRVVAPITLPAFEGSITVFLQFRDVLGRNYGRFYWLFPQTQADRYHLGNVEPTTLLEYDRVEFPPPAPAPIKGMWPTSTTNHFFESMRGARSNGMLVGNQRSVEDRGDWHDIR